LQQDKDEEEETVADSVAIHTTKTDHTEGGVVGDGDHDDDDDHDNNDYNDERDGHHRMRKGRGHDDRTNTTIK
jgi:hypothetical protein